MHLESGKSPEQIILKARDKQLDHDPKDQSSSISSDDAKETNKESPLTKIQEASVL